MKFGKYTLVEKLTTGGMAEVYRGFATGPGGFRRQVAVKKILPAYADDPEFKRMFFDEATIAARLNHANIAQIYDFDMVDGVPFIAMEYVEGKDLRSVLAGCAERNIRIPYPIGVFIALEVAKGLFYVHSRREASRPLNIVHRDVSPQNIMLSHSGEVKLVDFGIAHAVQRQAVTQAGSVKGKYAYMSPEQVMGRPLDHRTDIFSLGVVLWETLTLQRLFRGRNEAETIANVLKTRPQAPHKTAQDLPEPLSPMVLRMLKRDRSERYPSMLAFYEEMSRFLFDTGTYPDASAISQFIHDLFPEEMERMAQGENLDLPLETEDEDSAKAADSTAVESPGSDTSKPASVLPFSDTMLPDTTPAVPPGFGEEKKRVWPGRLLATLSFLLALCAVGLLGFFATEFVKKMKGEETLTEQYVQALDSDVTSDIAATALEPQPEQPVVVSVLTDVRPEPDAEATATGTSDSVTSEAGANSPFDRAGGATLAATPVPQKKKGVDVTFTVEPEGAVLRVAGQRKKPGALRLDFAAGDKVRVEVTMGKWHGLDKTLTVHPGMSRHFRLDKKVAFLELHVEPQDAKVWFHNKPHGRHPRGDFGYKGYIGEEVLVKVKRKWHEDFEKVYVLKSGPAGDGLNRRRVALRKRSDDKVTLVDDSRVEYSMVHFHANPYAAVWQDGKQLTDRTPYETTVPTGTHTYELRYIDIVHRCVVTVRPGYKSKCWHDFIASAEDAPLPDDAPEN